MPEMQLVPAPVLAPGRCATRGRHDGAMVDLMIRPDDPALSPYLCVTCSLEVGRLVGCLDPLQADELRAHYEAVTAEVDRLNDELEFERENKLMTVSDALALADRQKAKR